jgi:hypothetical protein
MTADCTAAPRSSLDPERIGFAVTVVDRKRIESREKKKRNFVGEVVTILVDGAGCWNPLDTGVCYGRD